MKILLTGGSGMVGKNILNYSKFNKLQIVSPSSNELDLTNYKAVDKFIKLVKPDLIIHAAGKVGGIQSNIKYPVDYLVKNLDIGRNLILAADFNNVTRFLNIASSCMYPKNAENPLKEEAILNGSLEPTNEGYALAKIVSTKLCEYISKEKSNVMYKTLIPCNLYGKYDKFDPSNSHMLPAVIRKIHLAKLNKKAEVEIWGNGKARREFMYAGDLADFVYLASQRIDELPQNINVGIGHDYSILDYYKTVANVIGYKGQFKFDLTKPTGMKQKLIDNSRQLKFGWKSETSLKEGIKNTYSYFKKINNYD